jgi:UDPglucose 6-dehydrogenase
VVNKSTVLVGTAARTAEMLNRPDVTVVSDPNSSAKVPQWKVFCTPTASWWAAMPRTPPSAWRRLYTRLGAPTVVTDSASSRSENQWFGYPRPRTVVCICYGL